MLVNTNYIGLKSLKHYKHVLSMRLVDAYALMEHLFTIMEVFIHVQEVFCINTSVLAGFLNKSI